MFASKLPGVLTAALCLLIVAGCRQAGSSAPTPTAVAAAQASATPEPVANIAIGAIHSQAELVSTEIIEQNNCGGSGDAETEVSRERQIERVMNVEAGVEVSAEGQVGVLGTHVNLGTTLATHLGYTYGSSESIMRSIVLRAGAGTNMRHTLHHQVISQVGDVTITVDEQRQVLPFEFQSDFALQLFESVDLGCPTLSSGADELRILDVSVASLADYDEGIAADPNQRNAPLIDIRVASQSQRIFITDARLAVQQRVAFASCLSPISRAAPAGTLQLITYRQQAPFALLPEAVYTFALPAALTNGSAEQPLPYTATIDLSQYILPAEPDRFGLILNAQANGAQGSGAQDNRGAVALLANVTIVYQILGSAATDAYEIATDDLLIIFPTDVEALDRSLAESFLTGPDAPTLDDPARRECVERNVTAAESLLALPAIGPWQSANLQVHLAQAKALLE